MTEPSLDIDRIVREVLVQLGFAPGAAAEVTPQVEPPMASSVPKEEDAPALASNNGELVVDSRVVTLSQLDGQLGEIRRLVVPHRAVVTPAVRDELHRRNVTLAFAAASTTPQQAAASCRLVLVAAGRRFDPAPLVEMLEKDGVAVEPHTSGCLIAATDQLAREVRQPNTLGLLVSRHTAGALCLANRHAGVRAVTAGDAPTVATVAAALGANLLVLDPAAASPFQLRQMAGEFCRGGIRQVPEVFRDRLG